MANARTSNLTGTVLEQILTGWLDQSGFGDVNLRHEHNPSNDEYSDYSVIYEAIFDSQARSCARIEIWLTKDGRIAVGIDSYERIARRLESRSLRHGFASGHEPLELSTSALTKLLDIVAAGSIAMRVSAIPLFGLLSCKGVIRVAEFDELLGVHYPTARWLNVVDDHTFADSRRVVPFNKWS